MKRRLACIRVLSVILTILVVSGIFSGDAEAKTADEIDASVDEAINRFCNQVDGARACMAQAKAVLVMPNVTSAGYAAGGEYGEGALRAGTTARYYKMTAGSERLTFGAEKVDIIILFMTQHALEGFNKTEGLGGWGTRKRGSHVHRRWKTSRHYHSEGPYRGFCF